VAILVDEKTTVLIQGITGVMGANYTKYCKSYGTNVIAGVTPGRKGDKVHGVPVFDSIEDAIENIGHVCATWISVPAPLVKEAALEAIDADIKLVVLFPDRVPLHDTLDIIAYAKEKNVKVIGPNSPGLISPGKAVLGATGGSVELAQQIYKPGSVGLLSRSGGITTTIASMLTDYGIGQSTCIGVGGDPVVGMPFAPLLIEFEKDRETEAVVIYGEIGTRQEEDAAEVISKGLFTKPLIAIIGGQTIMPGIRYSHAGAIVEGNRGTAQSKIHALEQVGAIIVDRLEDIPKHVKSALS
jgi:succinyl-CoA synthetase alpha subunit